jgi:hypothetical protein
VSAVSAVIRTCFLGKHEPHEFAPHCTPDSDINGMWKKMINHIGDGGIPVPLFLAIYTSI